MTFNYTEYTDSEMSIRATDNTIAKTYTFYQNTYSVTSTMTNSWSPQFNLIV